MIQSKNPTTEKVLKNFKEISDKEMEKKIRSPQRLSSFGRKLLLKNELP